MSILKKKKIYMIGIKGVGMTMLAQYLVGNGLEVSGSDVEEDFATTKDVLSRLDITVVNNFSINNIPSDADLIIYSSAYNADRNEEVRAALAGKIKTLTYAEAMGEIFNENYGIAVVGSHGKTTTTAWLGYVLEKAKKNPSVMVGSRVPQFDGASLVGKSDLLVIEADEYQNKLRFFNPRGVLLNNIDYDHPDFFKTKDDYEKVFAEFLKKIPKKGFLVANFDDKVVQRVALEDCFGKVISYGLENKEADYMAYDIKQGVDRQFFKVKIKEDDEFGFGGELGSFSIRLLGRHSISNALAVIAAATELGVELKDIREYLYEFLGTVRRLETMGKYKGAIIIDDYAHHPTEIKTTIAGVRKNYQEKKIVVVFHPHTFTRTNGLLNEFSESFDEADELIVLDIYGSAREEQGGVHSNDIINKIKKRSPSFTCTYIPTLMECEEYLRKNLNGNEVVLLMGAGDVFRIGEGLVNS